MHGQETENKKSFVLKVLFFIIVLVIIAALYFESLHIIDAVYFSIVFLLFIKYLIMKLYH